MKTMGFLLTITYSLYLAGMSLFMGSLGNPVVGGNGSILFFRSSCMPGGS
jgi:hypothetical protein